MEYSNEQQLVFMSQRAEQPLTVIILGLLEKPHPGTSPLLRLYPSGQAIVMVVPKLNSSNDRIKKCIVLAIFVDSEKSVLSSLAKATLGSNYACDTCPV